MLTPDKVFRPGKLPINPGNVYANRGDAEKSFKKSLRRGFIPLVYGEYGVGKTSMARHVVKSTYGDSKLVNVESVADIELADVFARCLEAVGYFVERRRVEGKGHSTTVGRGAETSGNTGWFSAKLFSKKSKSKDSTSSVEKELVVTSPTDSKVMEICESNSLVLILDELHRATDEFVDSLAKFIKAYGNSNCEKFKIILLGTSSDPSKLVQKDPGIDRLIEDLHLKSMEEPERASLVDSGMSDLAIQLDDKARERLIKFCVGSPNILQYLCLESAEAAFEREHRDLGVQDVEEAVKEYVEKKESRMYRMYMQAIENTGTKRYRKQILRAMSEVEDEVTIQHDLQSDRAFPSENPASHR